MSEDLWHNDRLEALKRTVDERIRQDKKWGQQDHPFFSTYGDRADGTVDHSPYYAHLEEAFKYKNAIAVGHGVAGWDTILLEEVFEALAKAGIDDDEYEKELVQVMAVACAMIEANQRRRRGEVG